MARQTDRPAARAAGPSRGRGADRPEPRRIPEHAHLTLAELRAYRHELRDEEGRVSYWRRILQGRLDLLSRTGVDRPDVDRFAAVLGESGGSSARTALARTVPVAAEAPLPDLAALWAAEVDPGDTEAYEDAVRRLTEAEGALSAYRDGVLRRLDDATAELIARYREDPRQCLSVLPRDPDDETGRAGAPPPHPLAH
jgi:hypothetical protein